MVIGPIPAGYSNQFAPLFVASSRTWSYHIHHFIAHSLRLTCVIHPQMMGVSWVFNGKMIHFYGIFMGFSIIKWDDNMGF